MFPEQARSWNPLPGPSDDKVHGAVSFTRVSPHARPAARYRRASPSKPEMRAERKALRTSLVKWQEKKRALNDVPAPPFPSELVVEVGSPSNAPASRLPQTDLIDTEVRFETASCREEHLDSASPCEPYLNSGTQVYVPLSVDEERQASPGSRRSWTKPCTDEM